MMSPEPPAPPPIGQDDVNFDPAVLRRDARSSPADDKARGAHVGCRAPVGEHLCEATIRWLGNICW
jgi:hypothetical protein